MIFGGAVTESFLFSKPDEYICEGFKFSRVFRKPLVGSDLIALKMEIERFQHPIGMLDHEYPAKNMSIIKL